MSAQTDFLSTAGVTFFTLEHAAQQKRWFMFFAKKGFPQ
tara:strand:+ start:2976 stop:3092 length:117 start_codon:yes stop_codon:yes gene_type:complete